MAQLREQCCQAPVLSDTAQQLPFQLFACQLQFSFGRPLFDEISQHGHYQFLSAFDMGGCDLPFNGEQTACP